MGDFRTEPFALPPRSRQSAAAVNTGIALVDEPRRVPVGGPFARVAGGSTRRAPRWKPIKRKVTPYLGDSVPMSWLAEAVKTSKVVLALGVSLWFQRGLRKKDGPILRVDTAVRKVMNLTADQARRAVAAQNQVCARTRVSFDLDLACRGACPGRRVLEAPVSVDSRPRFADGMLGPVAVRALRPSRLGIPPRPNLALGARQGAFGGVAETTSAILALLTKGLRATPIETSAFLLR